MSGTEDFVVMSGDRLTCLSGGANYQYFTIISDGLPDAIVPSFNFIGFHSFPVHSIAIGFKFLNDLIVHYSRMINLFTPCNSKT